MSQLQPVTLTYQGKEYTVEKEDSIWGLIEVIEDVIPFLDLAPILFNKKHIPTAKIFRAYAAALTYAGCKVTPNEVRESCNYQDMGQLAGALGAITMMAQPGKDIDLGESTTTDEEAEELKKKATDE